MIPAKGRTVICIGIESNGSREHPAVITRDWSGGRDTRISPAGVNLTVFPDLAMPTLRSSVMLFETRHDAEIYLGGASGAVAAFWPEREPAEPMPATAVGRMAA